jgi:hypothetical protein
LKRAALLRCCATAAGQTGRACRPLSSSQALRIHSHTRAPPCRVEVSLERAFEPGMAYVALRWVCMAIGMGGEARDAGKASALPTLPPPPSPCSRVKSMEGLRILGSIAPQALRAGGRWWWRRGGGHPLRGCHTWSPCRAARQLPPLPTYHLLCLPPPPPLCRP